jgi:hypothetical protein
MSVPAQAPQPGHLAGPLPSWMPREPPLEPRTSVVARAAELVQDLDTGKRLLVPWIIQNIVRRRHVLRGSVPHSQKICSSARLQRFLRLTGTVRPSISST